MCGITPPSAGQASILGVDMEESKHEGRRMIGYCPQFDCLWPKLTVTETLSIYASLRGYTGDDKKAAIEAQIVGLQLEEYRHRRAGTLSGGNKRKLSVAIALIGQPPVLFLDEPSTGMDPVARRFMWTVIQDLADNRKDVVVVLTTHSMDEAQALCERIAIQVDGSFRCLGTSQQIKELHGSGYELSVKFAPPPPGQDMQEYVYAHVNSFHQFLHQYATHPHDNNYDQQEHPQPDVNGLNAVFTVNIPTNGVANLMRQLQTKCANENVEDWSIAQVTLERVFNKFASQSENAGMDEDA